MCDLSVLPKICIIISNRMRGFCGGHTYVRQIKWGAPRYPTTKGCDQLKKKASINFTQIRYISESPLLPLLSFLPRRGCPMSSPLDSEKNDLAEQDANALFLSGLKLIRAVDEESRKKAIPYFEAAYKKQHNRAAIQLFMCYRHGFGVEIDQQRARQYLEKTRDWDFISEVERKGPLGFPPPLPPTVVENPESDSDNPSESTKEVLPPEPDAFTREAKRALRKARKGGKKKKKEKWRFP